MRLVPQGARERRPVPTTLRGDSGAARGAGVADLVKGVITLIPFDMIVWAQAIVMP
jgi:hypothetical protein